MSDDDCESPPRRDWFRPNRTRRNSRHRSEDSGDGSVAEPAEFSTATSALSEQEQFLLVRDPFLKLMLVKFESANQYSTKETLMVKCFKNISQGLNVDWASLVESNRNTFDLDDDVLRDVKKCWETKTNAQSMTADEQLTFERVMSRDYARHADVAKLILYMSRRCDSKALHRILAVDGFSGTELKKYIEHLKYPKSDVRARYVEFVRKMYDRLASPELVIEILHSIFQQPYDPEHFKRIVEGDYDGEDGARDPATALYWMHQMAWTFEPSDLETLFKWKEQQWADVRQQQQQQQPTQTPPPASTKAAAQADSSPDKTTKVVKRVKKRRPAAPAPPLDNAKRLAVEGRNEVKGSTAKQGNATEKANDECRSTEEISTSTSDNAVANGGDLEPEEYHSEEEIYEDRFKDMDEKFKLL